MHCSGDIFHRSAANAPGVLLPLTCLPGEAVVLATVIRPVPVVQMQAAYLRPGLDTTQR